MNLNKLYNFSLSRLQKYLNNDISNGYVNTNKQIIRGGKNTSFIIEDKYFPQTPTDIIISRCAISFDIANLIKCYLEYNHYQYESYVLWYKTDSLSTNFIHTVTIGRVNDHWIAYNNILSCNHFYLNEYENKNDLLKNLYKDFQERIKKLIPVTDFSFLNFYFDKFDINQIKPDQSLFSQIIDTSHEDEVRDEYSSMSIVLCNNCVLTLITTDNKYVLPKGHIEKGENSLQTAIRECQEETGVILTEADWVGEIKGFSYSFKGANCKYYTNSEFYRIFNVASVHKEIKVHVFEIPEIRPIIITEPENFKIGIWLGIDDFNQFNSYDNQKSIINEAVYLCNKKVKIDHISSIYKESINDYLYTYRELISLNNNMFDNFDELISKIDNSNTFSYVLVKRETNQVIGMAVIYYDKNNSSNVNIKQTGNINYSIHPKEQNKGYGELFLKLLLVKCHELHLDKVLITCSNDNKKAIKNILANNGIEDESFDSEVKHFWIIN